MFNLQQPGLVQECEPVLVAVWMEDENVPMLLCL